MSEAARRKANPWHVWLVLVAATGLASLWGGDRARIEHSFPDIAEYDQEPVSDPWGDETGTPARIVFPGHDDETLAPGDELPALGND
jgi:hypothetical protein